MKSQVMYVGFVRDCRYHDIEGIIFAINGDYMTEEECRDLIEDECRVFCNANKGCGYTRDMVGRGNRFIVRENGKSAVMLRYEVKIVEKI